jgi:hypothetical protein
LVGLSCERSGVGRIVSGQKGAGRNAGGRRRLGISGAGGGLRRGVEGGQSRGIFGTMAYTSRPTGVPGCVRADTEVSIKFREFQGKLFR